MEGKIQYEYDQLEGLVREFQDLSSDLQQTANKIMQKKEALRGGGWKGKGAEKFYQEMDDIILPALKRSHTAMDTAGDRIRKMSDQMKAMEDQLKSIMRKFADVFG